MRNGKTGRHRYLNLRLVSIAQDRSDVKAYAVSSLRATPAKVSFWAGGDGRASEPEHRPLRDRDQLARPSMLQPLHTREHVQRRGACTGGGRGSACRLPPRGSAAVFPALPQPFASICHRQPRQCRLSYYTGTKSISVRTLRAAVAGVRRCGVPGNRTPGREHSTAAFNPPAYEGRHTP